MPEIYLEPMSMHIHNHLWSHINFTWRLAVKSYVKHVYTAKQSRCWRTTESAVTNNTSDQLKHIESLDHYTFIT